MTKKNFIEIANVLNRRLHYKLDDQAHAQCVFETALALACSFHRDYPRFDHEKFMRAATWGASFEPFREDAHEGVTRS